jgi:hypothetical protein
VIHPATRSSAPWSCGPDDHERVGLRAVALAPEHRRRVAVAECNGHQAHDRLVPIDPPERTQEDPDPQRNRYPSCSDASRGREAAQRADRPGVLREDHSCRAAVISHHARTLGRNPAVFARGNTFVSGISSGTSLFADNVSTCASRRFPGAERPRATGSVIVCPVLPHFRWVLRHYDHGWRAVQTDHRRETVTDSYAHDHQPRKQQIRSSAPRSVAAAPWMSGLDTAMVSTPGRRPETAGGRGQCSA